MWDAYQSVQLMYNFGQLITQQKNNDFALRNLQVLAERFYYQARDASYRSSLTQSQISELAQNFVHLTSLIQTKNGIARHDKFSINLQVLNLASLQNQPNFYFINFHTDQLIENFTLHSLENKMESTRIQVEL